MLNKLRLFMAKRKLENSLKHEEMLRESAEYMRKVVIPAQERELEKCEVALMASEYFDWSENVR